MELFFFSSRVTVALGYCYTDRDTDAGFNSVSLFTEAGHHTRLHGAHGKWLSPSTACMCVYSSVFFSSSSCLSSHVTFYTTGSLIWFSRITQFTTFYGMAYFPLSCSEHHHRPQQHWLLFIIRHKRLLTCWLSAVCWRSGCRWHAEIRPEKVCVLYWGGLSLKKKKENGKHMSGTLRCF